MMQMRCDDCNLQDGSSSPPSPPPPPFFFEARNVMQIEQWHLSHCAPVHAHAECPLVLLSSATALITTTTSVIRRG